MTGRRVCVPIESTEVDGSMEQHNSINAVECTYEEGSRTFLAAFHAETYKVSFIVPHVCMTYDNTFFFNISVLFCVVKAQLLIKA